MCPLLHLFLTCSKRLCMLSIAPRLRQYSNEIYCVQTSLIAVSSLLVLLSCLSATLSLRTTQRFSVGVQIKTVPRPLKDFDILHLPELSHSLRSMARRAMACAALTCLSATQPTFGHSWSSGLVRKQSPTIPLTDMALTSQMVGVSQFVRCAVHTIFL